MASRVRSYIGKHPGCAPNFLETNLHYETIMGSHAYGVNNKFSDEDVYGVCIPPNIENMIVEMQTVVDKYQRKL